MLVLEKIIRIIFEPFRFISNKNLSERLAKFFQKNTYAIYLIAFVITILIFVIRYNLNSAG